MISAAQTIAQALEDHAALVDAMLALMPSLTPEQTQTVLVVLAKRSPSLMAVLEKYPHQ